MDGTYGGHGIFCLRYGFPQGGWPELPESGFPIGSTSQYDVCLCFTDNVGEDTTGDLRSTNHLPTGYGNTIIDPSPLGGKHGPFLVTPTARYERNVSEPKKEPWSLHTEQVVESIITAQPPWDITMRIIQTATLCRQGSWISMRLGQQSVFAYDHEPSAASSEVWIINHVLTLIGYSVLLRTVIYQCLKNDEIGIRRVLRSKTTAGHDIQRSRRGDDPRPDPGVDFESRGGLSFKRSASSRELLEPSLTELTIVRTPREGKVRGRGGVWLLIRFGLFEKPPLQGRFPTESPKIWARRAGHGTDSEKGSREDGAGPSRHGNISALNLDDDLEMNYATLGFRPKKKFHQQPRVNIFPNQTWDGARQASNAHSPRKKDLATQCLWGNSGILSLAKAEEERRGWRMSQAKSRKRHSVPMPSNRSPLVLKFLLPFVRLLWLDHRARTLDGGRGGEGRGGNCAVSSCVSPKLDAWLKLGRTKDLAVQAGNPEAPSVLGRDCKANNCRYVWLSMCLHYVENEQSHLDVLGFSSLESIAHGKEEIEAIGSKLPPLSA
ncbi:hypothetical protein CCUS01_03225 [Colletotrichum cuscutae]|uniref:Uncharacterized protein n=1 Tax=Colletotrichum cuscutae TaxID=1209917 RepID=A0AAJ0DLZ6_9PEZI|nr:hypothetical protein CCUS01_03225 [Colletotrichum cuscutae]